MHRILIASLVFACAERVESEHEAELLLPPEVACQLPANAVTPFPRLIVQYADGGSLQLDAAGMVLGSDGGYRFQNPDVSIHIHGVARGVWRMTLANVRVVQKVSWPFEHVGPGLGGNPDDDRVYFPLVGGVVEREGVRVPYGWHGYRYPGESFAPIMITADAVRATILASWDQERRSVYPMHGNAQSLLMHKRTYTILYGTVVASDAPAWFTAAAHHACWHNLSAPAPAFTPEMWSEEALLSVGAQDLSDEPTAPGQADVSFVYDARLAPYHAALGIGRRCSGA